MKTILLTTAILLIATMADAQQFSLVEVNPLHGQEQFIWSDSSKHIYGGGEFASFAELNGLLYFTAQDGNYNYELWVTDGTQQGTHVVKEINTTGSANPGKLHKVGNRIVFAATDDATGGMGIATYDVYATDGTEQGTVKIADVDESFNDFLSSSRVIAFNNKLVFCTIDKVMITDGTTTGTTPLSAISQYAQGFGYCELNGKVYFLINQSNQLQIWRTDGTVSGTKLMKNLNGTLMYAETMQAFNGKLYIVGAPQGQGHDLHVYDGTENGNVQKVNLGATGNSYPTELHVYNNTLWFLAANNTHNNLYKMDANDIVPVPVPSVSGLDVYGDLAFANNRVYFTDQMNNRVIRSVNAHNYSQSELELTDKQLPWFWQTDASFLVGMNNRIYFTAYDTLNQQQYFMVSDGTPSGTHSVMPEGYNVAHPFNALISCGMADAFDFTTFGNKIVVPANFNDAGRELWFFTDENTVSIDEPQLQTTVNLFPNPATDMLNISFANSNYCQTDVLVKDMSGKILNRETTSGSYMMVPVVSFSSGGYCAEFWQEGKRIASKKFSIVK